MQRMSTLGDLERYTRNNSLSCEMVNAGFAIFNSLLFVRNVVLHVFRGGLSR